MIMERLRYILAVSVMTLITRGEGLQLSFYQEVGVSPDSGRPCGVLSCVETTSSAAGRLLDANITSMAIFKTQPVTSDGSSHTSTRRGLVLASLTTQKPTVTFVSEALKVDGHLKAEQATLRLDLTQQEDCQAEFTCQVIALDAQGRELVNASVFPQQSRQAISSALGERGVESDSPKLLTLVQQISNKLESFEKLLSDQEKTTKSVVKYPEQWPCKRDDLLDHRVESLEKELKNKLQTMENRFEDKLGLLENKLDTFENRVEDKIENSVGTKLWQMNEKLSAITINAENLIAYISKAVQENLLNTKWNEQKQNENFLSKTVESIVNATLTSMITSSSQPMTNSQHVAALNDLTDIVTAIQNRSEDLERHGWEQLALLKENLLQVDSTLNSTAAEILSALQVLISNTNATSCATDIESVMTELLVPKTCRKGRISIFSQGSYPYPVISPSAGSGLDTPYLCDTVTGGGGWIIIQRRTTGSVDFYRDWATYRDGFGSLDDDFWLGNENIHTITSSGTYELRVELRCKGKSAFARYSTFSIGDEASRYKLSLGDYSGTAGESLKRHNGMPFSTYDRDNDLESGRNCAKIYTGAWWYKDCHYSNLNGKWNSGSYKGPEWRTFSASKPVSFSEMKVRRVDHP